MYPFERFTEKAKNTLTLAQEEAEKAHHSFIGTEHVLVAILRVPDGIGAQALGDLGITLGTVKEGLERLTKRRVPSAVHQVIPTSRVKTVIQQAFEEARRMGHQYVGTEHLVLGILIEGEGIAALVLNDLGVDVDGAREAIERRLAQGADEPGGSQPAPRLDQEVRAVLDRARKIALDRGADAVGVEHLREALG